MSNMKNQSIRTLLGVTVSAVAIAAASGMASPASAQTLTLPSGFNTVTIDADATNTGTQVTLNGGAPTTYNTIEIGNGIKAEIVPSWAAATWAVGNNTALVTGQSNWSGLNKCLNSSLAYSSTSCLNHAPAIQVDQGGTLVLGGVQTNSSITNPWGLESDVHADGNVVIEDAGSPSWAGRHLGAQFFGTNYFGGDLTLAPNALATFGVSWASADTQFGPNTNIILGSGSVMDLWLPGAGSATMGGSLQGTGTLVVDAGTLLINGQNTAGNPFLGTLTVKPGATLVVGDATHASAIYGDPGNPTAQTLQIKGTPSGAPTLRGYGTVDATVQNIGGVVQPGYTAGKLGNLTAAAYSQDATGTLKVEVSPTAVSGLHVLGNASMNGTLNIAIDQGAYKTQIYKIVQVDGTMTGDFTSITTSSAVQGAIAAVTKTSNGYQVVTEVVQGPAATAPIVMGHLVSADRLNNYYLVGSLYDRIARDTPRNATEIGRNKYVWAEGFGDVSSISRNSVGYHTNTEGVRAGAEYRTESNSTVGLAASYSMENLKAKGASTADIDTWHVAAYGGYDVQYAHLDGILFYDGYSTATKRNFGTDGVANANPGGYSYGGSIQVSKSMLHDLLTPYVRGIFSREHLDSSVETGSPLLNLRYNAINANTFVADLGFRIDPLRTLPESKTKLLVTVALEHDFSPLGENVLGAFPVNNGQSWSSYWRGDSENTALVGVDVSRAITDKLEISGRVNGRMSLYQTSGEISVHASYHL
jgi:hypothetical protein